MEDVGGKMVDMGRKMVDMGGKMADTGGKKANTCLQGCHLASTLTTGSYYRKSKEGNTDFRKVLEKSINSLMSYFPEANAVNNKTFL